MSNAYKQLEEALKDTLIAQLAAAVEARLETLNVSQAAVWLSGYVIGRMAADRKGLSVAIYDDPLQICLLDTLDPNLESMIFTRGNGG